MQHYEENHVISISLDICKALRNGVSPAISGNKDVTVISDCSPPVEPWGTQEEEEHMWDLVAIKLQPLPMVSPK